MIIHPDVRMTLLVQRTTREGERFFSMQPLDVIPPATMAGSITITHKIDASSPLAPALSSEGQVSPDSAFLRKCSITVTIVAADTTYAGDVQAIKRYNATDLQHGVRFADVMKSGKDGRPFVDFSSFNKVEPLIDRAAELEQQPAEDEVSAEVCF